MTPHPTTKAQWQDDGMWYTLRLRSLMRASISHGDSGRFHVTVLEKSEKQKFQDLDEAKRYAERRLREELTAALERIP